MEIGREGERANQEGDVILDKDNSYALIENSYYYYY